MPLAKDKTSRQLLYASYAEKSRETEAFVKEHALTRILSGNLLLHTTTNSYNFSAGDTVLIKRNQLAKATKIPPENGEFKSVTVYFDQPALKDYSIENKIELSKPYTGESVLLLKSSPLYESYASSLAAYQQGETDKGLTALKVKEALMLILYLNKEASGLLFDFYEPGKIDLEEYMNIHFRFNVGMARFAYLTGRSLATFKRDFAKTFNTSPSKWLQERRLKEAYYLIKEKRMKVSEVYLEVGFEDLSHFSFAFKNTFGKSPSLI
jgi:AraC-like DNA-binding protein